MWVYHAKLIFTVSYLLLVYGIASAYFYFIPAVQHNQPPASPTRGSSTHSRLVHPRIEKRKTLESKPSVKMKPIPLSYLRANLPGVSSQLELARLFTDSDVDDLDLSSWMLQAIPRAAHTPTNPPLMELNLKEITRGQLTRLIPSEHSLHKSSGGLEKATLPGSKIELKKTSSVARDSLMNAAQNPWAETLPGFLGDEPPHDDLEVFEAALHHLEEFNTSPWSRCQLPTPVLHRVRDPSSRTRVLFPECVLLHRCLNTSGCCQDVNHQCVATRTQIFTRAFLVVERHSSQDDSVDFSPTLTTILTFVNHTQCGCRPRPQPHRCNQSCPPLFHLRPHQDRCVCDCQPEANPPKTPSCQMVKDGLVSVSADDLECIKSGNCYKPDCTTGNFNFSNGFCPLSDEYALPPYLFHNPEDRRSYRDHLKNFLAPNPHSTQSGIDKGVIDVSQNTPEPFDFLSQFYAQVKTTGAIQNPNSNNTHGPDNNFLENYHNAFTLNKTTMTNSITNNSKFLPLIGVPCFNNSKESTNLFNATKFNNSSDGLICVHKDVQSNDGENSSIHSEDSVSSQSNTTERLINMTGLIAPDELDEMDKSLNSTDDVLEPEYRYNYLEWIFPSLNISMEQSSPAQRKLRDNNDSYVSDEPKEQPVSTASSNDALSALPQTREENDQLLSITKLFESGSMNHFTNNKTNISTLVGKDRTSNSSIINFKHNNDVLRGRGVVNSRIEDSSDINSNRGSVLDRIRTRESMNHKESASHSTEEKQGQNLQSSRDKLAPSVSILTSDFLVPSTTPTISLGANPSLLTSRVQSSLQTTTTPLALLSSPIENYPQTTTYSHVFPTTAIEHYPQTSTYSHVLPTTPLEQQTTTTLSLFQSNMSLGDTNEDEPLGLEHTADSDGTSGGDYF